MIHSLQRPIGVVVSGLAAPPSPCAIALVHRPPTRLENYSPLSRWGYQSDETLGPTTAWRRSAIRPICIAKGETSVTNFEKLLRKYQEDELFRRLAIGSPTPK
ncbi:hypothetical protein L2331_20435 [Mesorhizobium muleiense]|nr:hypothetical protein [Mesorhizobium muleiense]